MKLNKILSSALLVVMLFTTFAAAMPIKAEAAYTAEQNTGTASLNATQIKALVTELYKSSYSSAREMLDADIANSLVDSITSGDYTFYVNKYTGFLYYCNNVTGQILMSNPYNYEGIQIESDSIKPLISQLNVSITEISTNTEKLLYSTPDAALNAQIDTDFINNGIRVNYTLGDTTARYLLPGRMLASKFEELILVPMLKNFVDLMEEHFAETEGEYDVFTLPEYNKDQNDPKNKDTNLYYMGNINLAGVRRYLSTSWQLNLKNKSKYNQGSVEYKEINALYNDIMNLYGNGSNVYTLKSPAIQKTVNEIAYENIIKYYYSDSDLEISKTLEPIYVFTEDATARAKSNASLIFRKYAGGYSFSDLYEDEKICGYVAKEEKKPVFRCAIEYTFNDDGSLSARLPANSISFDETTYNLNNIKVLEYFGAGNITKDGYIFFPDGSGTVIEFDDFYNVENNVNTAVAGSSKIYGNDYCYSFSSLTTVSGVNYEQITMPVFGIVSTENSNTTPGEQVQNGFFAILEEGASLASLEFKTAKAHKYGNVYCTYSPYPSDKFDISSSISVGGQSSYTIVSDSKFNGSYVTRYAMLTDEDLGNVIGKAYYPSTYVGMASYYRDYLYSKGVLTSITKEEAERNLPLYIEALGSMDIITKVLSFPVTKSIPLTTFEDVLAMYNDLNGASESLDNINFRLKGFGKGGLNAAYPTKVRWERACGGKRAFKKLIKESRAISDKGENLGLYPEYDFMYYSFPEMFDGVSNKKNVSRMIDNRYASKQVYDSISNQYQSYFSLVISPDSLDKLYSKFAKKIGKYDISSISVSTLGSDLNSNFDEDNPINRYDAEGYVSEVLSKMVSENNFDIMLDKGNAYTLKYASHILNTSIDSSHFRYSSYSVPFIGMVLHGSINYTGTPINYSGTISYDILRSIESGAAPLYILCYENTSYMKEDVILSDYYGINYDAWRENIIETYEILNAAIGKLQDYKITDHRTIIGERVIEASEQAENYRLLMKELVEMLDGKIAGDIALKYKELASLGTAYGEKVVSVSVDRAKIVAEFKEILNLSEEDMLNYVVYDQYTFEYLIDEVIAKYVNEYKPTTDAGKENVVVNVETLGEYNSKYSFITDSAATDKDYVYTDYTSDAGNIILVTYEKTLENGEVDTVQFILNYNIYKVKINLNGEVHELGKYEYKPL